jgi:hypothetical protein
MKERTEGGRLKDESFIRKPCGKRRQFSNEWLKMKQRVNHKTKGFFVSNFYFAPGRGFRISFSQKLFF